MLMFDEEHIQQLVIEFAAKTSPLVRWDRKCGDDVFRALAAADNEVFQIPKPSSDLPYVIARKLTGTEGETAEGTSLVLQREQLQILLPRRVPLFARSGRNPALPPARDDLWGKDINRLAQQWFTCVQNALSGLGVQFLRVGKIYHVTFGPFDGNAAAELRERITGASGGSPVEFLVQWAERQEHKNVQYNVQTLEGAPIMPGGSRLVNVKIDVNNVDMSAGLEPGEWMACWNFADTLMPDHLWSVLGSERRPA